MAFEVTPDELQKSIEDATGRAQSSPFQEEKPPDTKSFGRPADLERPRGTAGPVRTGKSHLSRTVAFFAEDDQATAKKVQQKVDEAAARVGRIPGPPAPPPLPAGQPPPSAPPGVIGAAVIDVATTPNAPEPEHWHHPNTAQSKEAALKMKLLTSRKKTMIGGVKLLDVLDAQREAQQASGEFPPAFDPGVPAAPPPAASAPAAPPPAASSPVGPPPGERSQPFLAPHPLG
ncbi:MAG TPA: hypothetical protein VFB62_21980, partial [Polyangiaceae bacterium]|nr:hypothetical protein [Polyangiaceae bacterium]